MGLGWRRRVWLTYIFFLSLLIPYTRSTLGGGLGWLTPAHGLAIDNIVQVGLDLDQPQYLNTLTCPG